jgi:hypothetical protein
MDPGQIYQKFLSARTGIPSLIAEWTEQVSKPATTLASNDARVPGDGHFGPGTHKLIARLIDAKLDEVEKAP